MSSIVCTLYEGHYQIGVGALINSLVNQNFNGKIIVGYRGSLPDWLSQVESNSNGYFITKTVELIFQPLETHYHLTYYKPFFILDLFEKYSEINTVFYFDPDICNKCNWSFYERWVNLGLAVCLDNCYAILPSQHPWRCEWLELGEKLNYIPRQFPNFYCNAGFVGVKRSDISVLEIWRTFTLAVVKWLFRLEYA
jgi:hypothetical protein